MTPGVALDGQGPGSQPTHYDRGQKVGNPHCDCSPPRLGARTDAPAHFGAGAGTPADAYANQQHLDEDVHGDELALG